MDYCMAEIEGYPNYFVTTCGKIFSKWSGVLKKRKTFFHQGYVKVRLKREGKYFDVFVHRIVGKAFIPNEFSKPCINHIDGDKSNNVLENLEWVTYKENTHHAVAIGLKGPPPVMTRAVKCLNDGRIFSTIKDAGIYYGLDRGNISHTISGKISSTKGYSFEYLECKKVRRA